MDDFVPIWTLLNTYGGRLNKDMVIYASFDLLNINPVTSKTGGSPESVAFVPMKTSVTTTFMFELSAALVVDQSVISAIGHLI